MSTHFIAVMLLVASTFGPHEFPHCTTQSSIRDYDFEMAQRWIEE